ncbi:viperin family antiviral radical SAM protein [Caminibacter pacificus]|uniref:S-adenosylmethionine-dependent nucleotide dehydratase n=1 Tax=Caminibacter pacificus TaxID=1424653 RepID=A0AAJ4RDM4_9BACT|nr:viperin family antiviral radical SAM protein [Caminibacter pacificus]ROR40646.1 radical S-adenosyl methionine domain-containing protein 2 [Caminibacter pacificus]
MKEIVINWHIIQKCNYRCFYCFAKYEKSEREIYFDKSNSLKLLKEVYSYFAQNYKRIRLNLAGGEPLLVKDLNFIIKSAKSIGFDVSIITNFSNSDKILESVNFLTMIGISVDSLKEDTIKKIGRFDKKILNREYFYEKIKLIKSLNPNIQIKINTVVNRFNYNEFLGDFIEKINPNKWKILQAFPFKKTVFCEDWQYERFKKLHIKVNVNKFFESSEDMRESYIMVDPFGRFYQNSNLEYQYSESILKVGAKKAFSQVTFMKDKFYKRCQK